MTSYQPEQDNRPYEYPTDESGGPGIDNAGHTVVQQPGDGVDTVVYEDYWGSSETVRWVLPDGNQWLEIKKMNEGDRARYQYEAQLKMTTKRKSGDTEIDLDQAKDRASLIRNSVVNWNMRKGGEIVPFNRQALGAWIVATNPNHIDNLITKIRKFNPFLQEDLSSKDIREQITDLEEMYEIALKREAEADFSPSK